MDKTNTDSDSVISDLSPHYFQLKGKNAEEVVHELAQKTFFTDWCFLNPRLPDGKELCDLLIVFDKVAIIFQIKNLKLDEKGKYKEGEKEKNLSQLYGAKRSLFDLKRPIELENARRIREQFDPALIEEVHYISALIGEGEFAYSPTEEYKGLFINVLSQNALEVLLTELDTIADFTKYLRDKKAFFNKDISVIINGGEDDLMAYYLMNDKSFNQNDETDMLFLDGGSWEHLKQEDGYLRKKEADKISYAWDNIIDRAHEGSEQYEKVARELARPDRFKRRMLAKAFYDAYVTSHEKSEEYNLYRRMIPDDGVTYCYLFMDTDEKNRVARVHMLTAFCMVARIKTGNRKIIGIATNGKIKKINAYDYCVLDIPEITEDFQRSAEKAQEELGIMKNPTQVSVHEDEYPADGKNE